jgi:hypothetical protein
LEELTEVGKVPDGYKPSPRWKSKQCGIAQQLLADGSSEAEVRAIVKWLLTDAYWAERDVGLEVVRARRDVWIQRQRTSTTVKEQSDDRGRGTPAVNGANGINHGRFRLKPLRAAGAAAGVAAEPADAGEAGVRDGGGSQHAAHGDDRGLPRTASGGT